MLRKSWRIFVILLLLFVLNVAASQLSLVDPSFAIGSGPDSAVEAFYLQSDQRILVGGDFSTIHGQSSPYLARLNSDGSVDNSLTQQGITDGTVYRFVGLRDGKILVAGSFNTLLGASRHFIARLGSDGTLDTTFDAGNALAGTVYGLAVQDDGRIWVSVSTQPVISRIVRLQTNGAPDSTYTATNNLDGYIFALLPLASGGVLLGLNPQTDPTRPALVSLLADGQPDTNFSAVLSSNSTVFSLVREPDGHVLVGGVLQRAGQAASVPLLRMTPDLRWDDTFSPDTFLGDSMSEAVVHSLVVQPDGKIVAGGYFFQVGGYWRRELVRLTSEGKVDGCFDPGLGLGGATPAGPVRCLLVQPDGRILVGGYFNGIDEAGGQHHLARLLPAGPCDAIRVYFDLAGTAASPTHFASGTFPPGGTNVLETSVNLQDWYEIARGTGPYIYADAGATNETLPAQFLRARQER